MVCWWERTENKKRLQPVKTVCRAWPFPCCVSGHKTVDYYGVLRWWFSLGLNESGVIWRDVHSHHPSRNHQRSGLLAFRRKTPSRHQGWVPLTVEAVFLKILAKNAHGSPEGVSYVVSFGSSKEQNNAYFIAESVFYKKNAHNRCLILHTWGCVRYRHLLGVQRKLYFDIWQLSQFSPKYNRIS